MGILTSVSFNGKKLDPKKFKIEHLPDYEIPTRDMTKLHIEGIDGDYITNVGSYKNKPRRYSVSFGSSGPEEFAACVSEISDWLFCTGYGELEDTYEKDYFRLAVPDGDMTVKSILNGQAGKVDVTFSCIPKRFLKYGKKRFEYNAENAQGDEKLIRISNPGSGDAKPLLIIYFFAYENQPSTVATLKFSSDPRFQSDDTTMEYMIDIDTSKIKRYGMLNDTVANPLFNPIAIDCEKENIYNQRSKTNYNSISTVYQDAFPVLKGQTTTLIKMSGDISQCRIIPKFWTR